MRGTTSCRWAVEFQSQSWRIIDAEGLFWVSSFRQIRQEAAWCAESYSNLGTSFTFLDWVAQWSLCCALCMQQ